MISTSSSECECTGAFGFANTIPEILGNPFCYTARQPLIYYAKVQEPYYEQNPRNGKNNSNYFMKAFQWYSQELGPKQGMEPQSPLNNGGFAAWLDDKYAEYLKGSHREGSNLNLKQESNVDADGNSKKKKSKKKFGRLRSPWRRRRTNSKEQGLIDPNQSVQYILQPQDLSRPTESEFVARTSKNHSTTTVLSKESAKATKNTEKTKSLVSLYPQHDEREARKFLPKSKAKNVICECRKHDTGTQYDTLSLEGFPPPYHYKERGPQDKNEYRYIEILKARDARQCTEDKLHHPDVGPQIDERVRVDKGTSMEYDELEDENVFQGPKISDECECPPFKYKSDVGPQVDKQCDKFNEDAGIDEVHDESRGANVFRHSEPALPSTVEVDCQCSDFKYYQADGVGPKVDEEINDNNKDTSIKNNVNKQERDKGTVMFTDNIDNKDVSGIRTLSSQTSDHSIKLDHLVNEHPIFLRVVRLNDN